MKRHCFLTGLPSIGKTTALFRILHSLDIKTAGFHTEEIMRGHRRAGLNLVISDGSVFCVAERSEGNDNYILHTDRLEAALRQAFDGIGVPDVVYADTIGSLYCRSPYFVATVRSLLESHAVIGTIARRGHALVEEIYRRGDCEMFELTADNRDAVPKIVLDHYRK